MQKTLITFVVLAVLMVAFFLIIEYTGDSSVPTSAGNGAVPTEDITALIHPTS